MELALSWHHYLLACVCPQPLYIDRNVYPLYCHILSHIGLGTSSRHYHCSFW